MGHLKSFVGCFPFTSEQTYSIIYADSPWHYNGKMQFDQSGTVKNPTCEKDIFISSACFKYPTLPTKT